MTVNMSLINWRKVMIVSLILIVTWMGLQPKKAEAAWQFAAAFGAIEVGVLAFWGGAVLVASVGTAVGLDPVAMDKLDDFGKKVFDGANDAMKSSITWATSKVKFNSATNDTYEIKFDAETNAYLQNEWANYFNSVDAFPLSLDPVTKMIKTTDSLVGIYASMERTGGKILGAITNIHIKPYLDRIFLFKIDYLGNNVFRLHAGNTYTSPINRTYDVTLPFTDVLAAYSYMLSNNYISLDFDETRIEQNPTLTNVIAPDVLGGLEIPASFPDVFTMPSPQAVINPAGDVTIALPTIGFPAGVNTGNPADVAIGYPAIPGDVGALNPADSISTVPVVTAPTVPPVTPPLDWSIPSGKAKIDWSPLLLLGADFTTIFPFSIPWDLKRQMGVFDVDPVAPKINFDHVFTMGGLSYPVKFELNFTTFDLMAKTARYFLVIVFDIAIILGIRRIMSE